MSETYTVISYPGSAIPEAYKNLIYSKWLRSQRFGSDYYRMVPSHVFFQEYQHVIDSILSTPNTTVHLAVLSSDHDVVLGWSAFNGNTLHYVHVHKDARKQGIATHLVPDTITQFSSLTNVGLSIWGTSPSRKHLIFNPFAKGNT